MWNEGSAETPVDRKSDRKEAFPESTFIWRLLFGFEGSKHLQWTLKTEQKKRKVLIRR